MKLRYKIAGGLLIVLAVAIVSLALVLSHNSACEPAPALAEETESMKAIVYRCYGSPDVLKFEDVEKPTPADDEVLVKVHAASVNPFDWHHMRGSPYIMRLGTGLGAPDNTRLGVDFAGTVEAVGSNVKRFKPGDEVFGGRGGAFAEYVTVPEDQALVLKPANMTFAQAASVPIAAITALQALRDKGKIKPGQKVLINGASGGVGTFAVQIAKSFGAEVTGVCSTRNVDMVRSIGADHVIDYTKEDYTESGQRFDLIIDMVGNHSLLANRQVLSREGILVIVGGPKGDWLTPLMGPIKAMMLSPFVSQEFVLLLATMDKEDLAILGELMQDGKMTPVIDRSYRLSEVPAAIRYSEEGHARGKIVIELEYQNTSIQDPSQSIYEQRPMKLPEHAMGTNCPVSVGLNDIVSSEHKYIFGAGGYFFGNGPVYLGLAWKPRDRKEGYFDLDGVPKVPEGFRLKTPWIMDPAYDGEALVRGARIGISENREILFNGGSEFIRAALILRSEDRPATNSTLQDGKIDAVWGWWPTSMILPEPGCYAIQIDTETNSDIVVFEATLKE